MYYLRPDEIFSYGSTVDIPNLSATYTAGWLCDAAPRPVRSSDNDFGATITFPGASYIDTVVLALTNLDEEKDVTIGGDLSGTLTTPVTPPDGIPYNGFAFITPVPSAAGCTLALSSNSVAPIIGEAIFGKRRYLKLPLASQESSGIADFSRDNSDGDLSTIMPRDPRLAARDPYRGVYHLTERQYKDEIVPWFQAQRNRSRPSVLIPDVDENDAWLCFMRAPKRNQIVKPHSDPYYRVWAVELIFDEIPRCTW